MLLNVLISLFFITGVFCSAKLDDYIQKLKSPRQNEQAIYEKIVDIHFDTEQSNELDDTCFRKTIDKMAVELKLPRELIYERLFLAYSESLKRESVSLLSQMALGRTDMALYVKVLYRIGKYPRECSNFIEANKDFVLPESYIFTFLNTLKTIYDNQNNPAVLMHASLAFSILCSSGSCFRFCSSTYLEHIQNFNLPLLSVGILKLQTETEAFDEFIRELIKLNRSGKDRFFPLMSISKVILYGPFTPESFDILMGILNEDSVRMISLCPDRFITLSHNLVISGRLDEFIGKLSTLRNKDLETISEMKTKIINYATIQKLFKTVLSLDSDNVVSTLQDTKFVKDHSGVFKKFYLEFSEHFEDDLCLLSQKISNILSNSSQMENVPLKSAYMNLILTLMNIFPSNTVRKFAQIDLEPFLDFLLDPKINSTNFPLEWESFKYAVTSPYAQFSQIALSKIYAVFRKFDFFLENDFTEIIIRFVKSESRRYGNCRKMFETIYQFALNVEMDPCLIAEPILLHSILNLDSLESREILDFCINNNLISKTQVLNARRFLDLKDRF